MDKIFHRLYARIHTSHPFPNAREIAIIRIHSQSRGPHSKLMKKGSIVSVEIDLVNCILEPVPSTLTFQELPVFSTFRQCFLVYSHFKGLSPVTERASTTCSVSILIGDCLLPSLATGNSLCHSEGPMEYENTVVVVTPILLCLCYSTVYYFFLPCLPFFAE